MRPSVLASISLALLWGSPCAIRTSVELEDIIDDSEEDGSSKGKEEARVSEEGRDEHLKEEAVAENNREADELAILSRKFAHHNLLELDQTADISTLLKAVQVSDNATATPNAQLKPGWTWIKRLGEGSYGEVWSVCLEKSWGSCKTKNALKVIPAAKAADVEDEVKLQKQVQPNKFAVKVNEDWTDSKGDRLIAMELLPDGDLFDAISPMAKGRGKYKAHLIFHDLIDGLQTIHQKRVMHGDIKPENIFCDAHVSPVVCKFGDFGLSQEFVPGRKTLSAASGTPDYASPEIWKADSHHKYIGPEVDVWAMGVMLFMMLTNNFPFYGSTMPALAMMIANREPNYAKVEVESAKWLLEKMLKKKAEDRLTIPKIKVSCFYQGYKKGDITSEAGGKGCTEPY